MRLEHVAMLVAVALIGGVPACGSGSGGSPAPVSPTMPSAPSGPGAPVATPLEIPTGMEGGQIVAGRSLQIPPGFGIRVFDRVSEARFMAAAPNGDVLVSQPNQGRVLLLRPRGGQGPEHFVFLSGLTLPHDLAFHTEGGKTWLYVAESRRVARYAYASGQTAGGTAEVLIDNLPDASLPELHGAYGHPLKNIAISSEPKLYVAIASSCNACASDADADPVRGSIYIYDTDGGNGRLFARGLRNAEGLRFLPGTNRLFAVVNQRDDIAYPYHGDFDGDGKDDYGRVMQSFVDGNPPEMFTAVRDGGDYGWPFCNANPRAVAGTLDLPLERDVQTNADGARRDCAALDRVSVALPAHSAPLGMSFLQDSNVPASLRGGAVVGLHGCWDCSRFIGHEVVFVPFDAQGRPGAAQTLVTGFILDPVAKTRWGRPVDVVPHPDGSLLISDDYAGAIYALYPK